MKERDMQAMSLQHLALFPRLEVFRVPDEVYLCLRLAAEGKKVSRGLAIKARAGLAGWPDELVFKGISGCPYALAMIRENKVEKGTLTPAQKELYNRLDIKGIPYVITRSLDANLAQSRALVEWEGLKELESGEP